MSKYRPLNIGGLIYGEQTLPIEQSRLAALECIQRAIVSRSITDTAARALTDAALSRFPDDPNPLDFRPAEPDARCGMCGMPGEISFLMPAQHAALELCRLCARAIGVAAEAI